MLLVGTGSASSAAGLGRRQLVVLLVWGGEC